VDHWGIVMTSWVGNIQLELSEAEKLVLKTRSICCCSVPSGEDSTPWNYTWVAPDIFIGRTIPCEFFFGGAFIMYGYSITH